MSVPARSCFPSSPVPRPRSRRRLAEVRSMRRLAIIGLLLWCSAVASSAEAQVGGLGGQIGPELVSPPVSAERANPFEIPSREYSALPLGPWLLYPTVFVGSVFDDNVNQTPTNRVTGAGIRVVPSLLAQANDGIHKTTLYGTMDARAYFNGGAAESSSVAARTGLAHTYEVMTDVVVGLQGDYTRQKDLFDSFSIDRGGVASLNTTAVGLTPVANPQSYNQFAGSASVRKTFDRTFASLAASVVDIVYDTSGAGSPAPNGSVYTATGRAGHWFVPFLYAYAEASVDQRRYTTGALNSSGYRTVGGLGSDQIGLFRGEIYGGYQAERYDAAAFDNVSSAVYGGRLYYYPSRALTLTAAVDRSLGVSQATTSPVAPFGTATRVTTALLAANYAFAPEWSANARFGYIRSEYVGSTQLDNAWAAGATIAYSVWQNFGLTLDYQFMQKHSNALSQNFTRNVITLGASYKY